MGLRTTLYGEHVALGARLVDFAGWEMPLQYSGVMAEHNAVRTAAGLFDTCHMDAIRIAGTGSLAALSHVFTAELRTLAVGACRYGFLLDETAGVLDDLIVYRLADSEWLAVVNAGTAPQDVAWLRRHCEGPDCVVDDLRDKLAKIDLQGPDARSLLKEVLALDTGSLKRFRWLRPAQPERAAWLVSRTGYTGEDGVEIYAPTGEIREAWRALVAAGVTPCGLASRDTLRLEAGLPLYGHEFDRQTSPAEAGMMRYCSKEEPFIGREALLQRAAAPQELLVRFTLEGRQTARHGQPVVTAAGIPIGRVTSGSFAPTAGHAIGFAYVKPEFAAAGTSWLIDTGRNRLAAVVTDKPFIPKEK